MTRNALLLTTLALLAAPAALAHDGDGSAGTTTQVSPNTQCWEFQNPHDYVMGQGATTKGQLRSGTYPAVWAFVDDHNLQDCDFDGIPADFDGDYEYGSGGGFFPAGQWAEHPDCDYGITPHHGFSFHVHSEVPAEPAFAHFVIGADPTPPTYAPSLDPNDDDGWDCATDGAVTPSTDPDDWLQPCKHTCPISAPPGNVNPLFGMPGGDGGYWVWIDCDPRFDGIPSNPQPCSTAGHIWSPSDI